MIAFTYVAYDREGARVQGQIEALSLSLANDVLHKRGLLVVSIEKDTVISQEVQFFSRSKVTSKELEYLTGELALLLNSGVTVDRGLGVIRRNSISAPQAKLVANLHDAVRRGQSLSEAMEGERIFSNLYVNLVQLGEATGTLPDVFARLSEDIKFQSELRQGIVQALTYPAAVCFVCILCVVFIFNYIVPQMGGLFEGLPDIPTYTKVLLNTSEWMVNYQWMLLVGISLGIAAISALIRTPSGAQRFDEILMGVPIFSKVFLLVERIRFNTAISMMLSSGILIDRCLEMAIGSVKSLKLRENLILAKDRVKKGDALASALAISPLYPDFYISLIEVGEESGQLQPVFAELTDRSRREFEAWVSRFTSLLEPLLILFMGGIVGGVVVVMLLSIVSVNDMGF
jgi:type II secretory pathway component PulF